MPSSEFGQAIRLVHSQLKRPSTKSAVPVLIVLTGLPGTGKSTVAQELSQRLPAIVIASDFVRKTLFPEPTYSGEESRFVHSVSRAVMGHYLQRGYSVIADATNLSEWHRSLFARTAERNSAPMIVVQTVAPERLVRSRLRRRLIQRTPGDFSDADWEVYQKLATQVEPIRGRYLRVDTSRDLASNIQRVLRAVRRAVKEADARKSS
jgi:predicted kinase